MSLMVANNDSGLCYNSMIRNLEKAEITKKKEIICPDIEDFITTDRDIDIVWYKVKTITLLVEIEPFAVT